MVLPKISFGWNPTPRGAGLGHMQQEIARALDSLGGIKIGKQAQTPEHPVGQATELGPPVDVPDASQQSVLSRLFAHNAPGPKLGAAADDVPAVHADAAPEVVTPAPAAKPSFFDKLNGNAPWS